MSENFIDYYDIEMKCNNCNYTPDVIMVGPIIPPQNLTQKAIVNDGILYCSSKETLVHIRYRAGAFKKEGENICKACGEKFVKQTLLDSPIPNIKHCWGMNHLELNYDSIIYKKEVSIPCPKCLQNNWTINSSLRRLNCS